MRAKDVRSMLVIGEQSGAKGFARASRHPSVLNCSSALAHPSASRATRSRGSGFVRWPDLALSACPLLRLLMEADRTFTKKLKIDTVPPSPIHERRPEVDRHLPVT